MAVTAPSAAIQDRTAWQSTGIAAGPQQEKAGEEFLWALFNKFIYVAFRNLKMRCFNLQLKKKK